MTTETSLNQKITLSSNVLIQHLANESVLLDLQSELYFTQNDIATKMLFTLIESDSLQATYNSLLQEYDVEPEKLKKDLLEFVDKLVKAELIEISDS